MQSPEGDSAYDQLKEEIKAVPSTPQIPEHLEKGGVSATPGQFTAQVADDQGNPLVQATTEDLSINLPASEESLEKASKGKITDAVTWFAKFWLRMIKKAAHFGWRVVKK